MSLLLNAALKVSVIVAIGFVAAALLRRRSAALRHWVLAAAIVCAAAAPMLTLIVPAWHAPSPSWSSTAHAIDPSEWIALRDATADALTSTAVHRPPATIARRVSVSRALAVLWLLGAIVSVSLLAIGLARLSWVASRAQPIQSGRWAESVTTVSRAFGLSRPVKLLQSEHPTLLVTWGILRPAVILPASARDWPETRVRIVLSHELAHIRRGDWVVQLLAELLRAVYWFNPLLWIACRRVRQESEHACDDAVLRLGVEGSDYASHLLDVARSFSAHRHVWSPALAIARPSSLERRVRAMLNAHLDRNPITRTACVLAVAVLLAVTIPLAGFTAFADAATTLAGSVVDQMGRGVADVALELSNAQTRARYEVRTDQTGRFAFVPLPSGEYTLDATQPGFTAVHATLTLAGSSMQRDLTMQIGEVLETITVTGNNPPRTPANPSAPRQPRTEVDPCLDSPAGGCILAPTMVRNVRPMYPEGLLASKMGGTVKLEGHITTDGSVSSLQVLGASDPAFAGAALDAVGQWQFTPTHLDGTPIDTRMLVVVAFKQP